MGEIIERADNERRRYFQSFCTMTPCEVVDIIFVATLLYTAIVWAQRMRAVFVMRGILILGGIFLIARYFDLQMTAWVLQGFFAALLIVIVVIFKRKLDRCLNASPSGA